MLSFRAPLPMLRGMLALMVSVLVLLSGVAQQRAFAAKLPASGQMQLCLPGMDGPPGQPADKALHDCFECCLGAPVAVPMPGVAQGLAPDHPVAQPLAVAQPLQAHRASERPPSRGPPRQG